MMANEARQRQEELVAIARAAGVEVDLGPDEVPPTPHTGVPESNLPLDEGNPSLEIVRSPSPALDVAPLCESIPALRTSKIRADSTDSRRPQREDRAVDPPEGSSPKHRRSDKGKKVMDSETRVPPKKEEVIGDGGAEPQSPVFMGVDTFSHLLPGTIDKLTHRLGICYKRLARARQEITQALNLNTRLPAGEAPFVPD
ncbi:hypothetical protein Salat_2517400 [Sesamum alatum]|uniref:Uncharacterized protein n=1 Tax=Sesamum alatum TaxID=300844 RepID=A0AAE1XRV7_9LAMI|nr:hypothetical protein Salat_2517400 [Sesamum alatum]